MSAAFKPRQGHDPVLDPLASRSSDGACLAPGGASRLPSVFLARGKVLGATEWGAYQRVQELLRQSAARSTPGYSG